MGLDYAKAGFPIREDLPDSHREAWRRLASAGTWWSGAERVAIAAEVRAARDCALCTARKDSLSPAAVSGVHDGPGELRPAVIEVIHWLTTDPGRLSKSWFDRVCADGLDEGPYVETVGVVVTVVSIDSFCRGIGVALHDLPEPLEGEPSRYRPAAACDDGAWVPMLPNRRARGDEADLWTTLGTGNVIRAMSLVPDEVRTLNLLSASHYLSMEQMTDLRKGREGITRQQIELLAGRVSALNQCFY
ncbi:MAG: hypothetical protein IH884_08645 [Myxococcales bacterium]|nr:hypothetical protein [Myxococcales bacterium]